MKTIYEFYWNCKYYRSTSREILELFAWCFSMVVDIQAVGESEQEIELQKV